MKQSLLNFLANLRVAIFLLLVIASTSILGTIIEQDQNIEVYKLNYPITSPFFGFLSWDVILKFGLDHLYKTFWFISLIFLFGLSLFTCTFSQQLPAFKIARRCQFFRANTFFKKLQIYKKFPYLELSNFVFKLKKNYYSIFQQKNIFYGYKGLIGRIGPILVHFSMIMILIGAVISSTNGLNGQEIVSKTETFHFQNIFSNGKFTQFPDICARVNDFWIFYKLPNIIEQFYSNISILNSNGEEINTKTIFVNSPLKFLGIDLYQTSWNLSALRLQLKNELLVQYPLINLNNNSSKIWVAWIPSLNLLSKEYIILVDTLQGYCSFYNEFEQFIGNIELNETTFVFFPYYLNDIVSLDGLQIKTDSGIFIIYSGFFLLMFTTVISYKSYSQIWVFYNNLYTYLGGNTTRAKFEFEFEFVKLLK